MCSYRLKASPRRGFAVSLLRDARIPADIDLTDCVVRHFLHNPPRWATALVEIYGSSETAGIRARRIASGTVDLGIADVPIDEAIEAYALLDRRLKSELFSVAASSKPGRRKATAQLASAFPSFACRATVQSVDHLA